MFVDVHTHHDTIAPADILAIRSYESAYVSLQEINTRTSPFSVGIHPWRLPADLTMATDLLLQQAALPACVAIGECGLDKRCSTDYEAQRVALCLQLDIAEALRKPVVLHMVRSVDDFLNEIDSRSEPPVCIIHGFRGRKEQARQLIRKRIVLSFGQYHQPESILEAYHSDALLLETDAAMVSISQVYQDVCDTLSISMDELVDSVYVRACSLFPRLCL